MERRKGIEVDILDIPEKNQCYICGRTKAQFHDDICKKKILEQESTEINKRLNSLWEACENELINTNLINEWIKYLDTSIDKISVDKYSDFEMATLKKNDIYLERIPNLPLLIHFGLKHFENRENVKLKEVVDYLLNVKSILENFNEALPIEDLLTVVNFFSEFYIYEGHNWDNYAVSCYLENQKRGDREVDVTVIPIFKKIDNQPFIVPYFDLLNELNIQKLVSEHICEFSHVDISLSFGDYRQDLRIFVCPICENTIRAISKGYLV